MSLKTFKAIWFKRIWRKATVEEVEDKVKVKFYMKDGSILEMLLKKEEWDQFWQEYYNFPVDEII